MLKTLARVRRIGSLLWHVDAERIQLLMLTEYIDRAMEVPIEATITVTPTIDGVPIGDDESRQYSYGGWIGQGDSVEQALETLLIVLSARCRDYEKDLAALNEECKKCGSTAIFGCLVTCAL
jgi:hypothetical protein